MVNMIRISIVILMIAVLGFFTGCEKQSETKKPARAVIVSGKILPPPGKTGEKLTPQSKNMGPVKTGQAQTIPKTDAKKTVQVPSRDITQESLKNEQTIVSTQPGEPVTTEEVPTYDSNRKIESVFCP